MDSAGTLFDAHFHLRSFLATQESPMGLALDYRGIVSCHDPLDVQALQSFRAMGGKGLHGSFGFHPQWPVRDHADLFLSLLESGSLAAIGECGFDFFDERSPQSEQLQAGLFEEQIALAHRYSLPLIIHLRKATDKIFRYRRELARLRGVIFHSWPGPVNEAMAIRRGGINGYFSFGTTLLWNAPKAMASLLYAMADPAMPFLLETDMPWQPIRGKTVTGPEDLRCVYEKVQALCSVPLREFCPRILENLSNLGIMVD